MQVFVSHFDPRFKEHIPHFQNAAPDARFTWFHSREELEAEVHRADVIAGLIKADALARAENLKWVSLPLHLLFWFSLEQ